MRGPFAAVIACSVLVACSAPSEEKTGDASEDGSVRAPSSAASNPPTVEEGPVASSAETLAAFRANTTRWNDTLTPVVLNYNDPAIGRTAWLSQVQQFLRGPGMKITKELRSTAAQAAAGDLRKLLRRIADNYQLKYRELVGLSKAVASNQPQSELDAQQRLATATSQGNDFGVELLDYLKTE